MPVFSVEPKPGVVVQPPTKASACRGDCHGDARGASGEIVVRVTMVLGAEPNTCPAFDRDQNGTMTMEELVAGRLSALQGCSGDPRPTFRVRQAEIFPPRRGLSGCHLARGDVVHFDLESDSAHVSLIDTPPAKLRCCASRLRVRTTLQLGAQPFLAPSTAHRFTGVGRQNVRRRRSPYGFRATSAGRVDLARSTVSQLGRAGLVMNAAN
ncbi:MAG: hypothetical protein KatS3mg077_0377 [Candidatus Binatia bacterium]|nr:MAG: hypothetical protein KatS3mg077_0377 [Candidatus Binatia bacterium]